MELLNMLKAWFRSYTTNPGSVLQSHHFNIHCCCLNEESEVNLHWIDPDYSRSPEFNQPLAAKISGAVSWPVLTLTPRGIPVLSLGYLEDYCLTAQQTWVVLSHAKIPVWFVHHKDHPTAAITKPPLFCHTVSFSKSCIENASFPPLLPLSTTLVTIKMPFWPPVSNLVLEKNKQFNKGLICSKLNLVKNIDAPYYSVPLFPSLLSYRITFLPGQLGLSCTQHPFPFTKTTKTQWGSGHRKCCKQEKSIPSLWHLSCWGAWRVLCLCFSLFLFFLFFFPPKSSFAHFPSCWFKSNWKWNLLVDHCLPSLPKFSFTFTSFITWNAWRRKGNISSCCVFYTHVMPT